MLMNYNKIDEGRCPTKFFTGGSGELRLAHQGVFGQQYNCPGTFIEKKRCDNIFSLLMV